MIIVSACLCGIDCKYNGGNNKNEKVIESSKAIKATECLSRRNGGLPSTNS